MTDMIDAPCGSYADTDVSHHFPFKPRSNRQSLHIP
jgi:hypothetical protein